MKLKNIHHVPKRTPGWQQPETEQKKFTPPPSLPQSWQRSIDRPLVDPAFRDAFLMRHENDPLPISEKKVKEKREVTEQIIGSVNPASNNSHKSFPGRLGAGAKLFVSGWLGTTAIAGPLISEQLLNPPAIYAQEKATTPIKINPSQADLLPGLRLIKEDNIEKRAAYKASVVEKGKVAWETIKSAAKKNELNKLAKLDNLWDDIIAASAITDDTMVAEMEPIRHEILEIGASSIMVSPEIVHALLYNNGILADKINLKIQENNKSIQEQEKALTSVNGTTEENKSKTSDTDKQLALLRNENQSLEKRLLAISKSFDPYFGAAIIDNKGERILVPSAELEDYKKNNPEAVIYGENKGFDLVIPWGLGQAGVQKDIDEFADELAKVGNNVTRADLLFKFFQNLHPSKKLPPKVTEIVLERIFGKQQMLEHKKSSPPSASIPGIPSNAKVGSLDLLVKLDPKLVSPKLPCKEGKDAKIQERDASHILSLVINNNEHALSACAQWFAQKPYSESESKTDPSNADLTVLQALAILAQKDKKAFDLLTRVGTSFPHLVIASALLEGSPSTRNTPLSNAGKEVLAALRLNQTEAKKWFTKLLDQDFSEDKEASGLIWADPSKEEDIKSTNAGKDYGSRLTLSTVTYFDTSNSFTDKLRSILKKTRLTEEKELKLAIIGVGLAKDEKSIDDLINIAIDPKRKKEIRILALQALSKIDTNSLYPEKVLEEANKESPFSTARMQYFFGEQDKKTGAYEPIDRKILSTLEEINPFKHKFSSSFKTWEQVERQAREGAIKLGTSVKSLTEEDKVREAVAKYKIQFGGTKGILAQKALDPNIREGLRSLTEHLKLPENGEKSIDVEFAIAILEVLEKAEYIEAGPTIAKIVSHTEEFTSTPSFPIGDSQQTQALKEIALQALGACIDLSNPDDSGGKALLLVVEKNTGMSRAPALTGLITLADRYESKLKQMEDGEPKKLIQAKRQEYQKRVFAFLPIKTKNFTNLAEEPLVKAICKLGGTKDLLSEAYKLSQKNPRDPVVASLVIPIVCNRNRDYSITLSGIPAEEAKPLEDLYAYVVRQEFWLPKERKYTGKDLIVAIVDGSFVSQPDDKTIFPPSLKHSNLSHFEDPHGTAVFKCLRDLSPNAKVISYDAFATMPERKFAPKILQDPAIQILEDIAQGKLSGELDVDIVNCSWGFTNGILHDRKARTKLVDLVSAFMNVQEKMTLFSVAAGNGRTSSSSYQFGSLGSVTNFGVRFDKNNKIDKLPNVFIASAIDAFTGELASFSSAQNELRVEEAVDILSYHGDNVISTWVKNGTCGFTSIGGTSFAAPYQSAILTWAIEAREVAGLRRLTAQEWQEVLKASAKDIPNTEPYEGGRYLHVPTFLVKCLEIYAPKEKQKQSGALKINLDTIDKLLAKREDLNGEERKVLRLYKNNAAAGAGGRFENLKESTRDRIAAINLKLKIQDNLLTV